MNYQTKQPNYGPTDFELNLDFQLDFSFSEYLLAGLYVICAVPVILVVHGLMLAGSTMQRLVVQSVSPKSKRMSPQVSLPLISRFF